MNKVLKFFICLILGLILAVCGLYFFLGYYYRNGFSYGTYVNGVYLTGKSVEEGNRDLTSEECKGTVEIDFDNQLFSFDLRDIGYNVDYSLPLQAYLDSQNPYLWIENVIGDIRNYTISPEITLDREALTHVISSFGFDTIKAPYEVKIVHTSDGYELIDNKKEVPDNKLIVDYVEQSIVNGALNIELTKECYSSIEYSNEDKRLIDLFEVIDECQNREIVFDFNGNEIALNKTEIISLYELDDTKLPKLTDTHNLYFTKESVVNGLTEALSKYNTYNNHYFETHSNKCVYLDKGTYGNEFDINVEAEKLYEAMINGTIEYRSSPELIHSAMYFDVNDIGNTYLEISLDEQHMYYYENGKLMLDIDVVTGNRSHRSDTPEGVYYIYYKQRNRTLVGATYRSFVKYWMAFVKHVGVHDASWRSEYGDDIYLTSGSHGCVNTPEEYAAKLYDMIEEGTPVIVYSLDKSEVH